MLPIFSESCMPHITEQYFVLPKIISIRHAETALESTFTHKPFSKIFIPVFFHGDCFPLTFLYTQRSVRY